MVEVNLQESTYIHWVWKPSPFSLNLFQWPLTWTNSLYATAHPMASNLRALGQRWVWVMLLSLLCITPLLNGLSYPCLGCSVTFHSPALLAGHLNDSQNLCSFDMSKIKCLVPPALYSHSREEVNGRYHFTLGYIYGKGNMLLETLRVNEHERHWEDVIHYPFADEGERKHAKFLIRHLTQTAINEFLHLKWVYIQVISTLIISTTNAFEQFKTWDQPTFLSTNQMLGWMDTLPGGPTWWSTTLEIRGCTTTCPIHLMWHDAWEVVEDTVQVYILHNSGSLDSTFKISNKATVSDKDCQRAKYLKGGVLSVINEESEIIAWVCHTSDLLTAWLMSPLFNSASVRQRPTQKSERFSWDSVIALSFSVDPHWRCSSATTIVQPRVQSPLCSPRAIQSKMFGILLQGMSYISSL